jgi:hypothetical protein
MSNFKCGYGNMLYANLTSHSVNFDLLLNNALGSNGGTCTVSFSWVDGQGNLQTETASSGFSTMAASSLPAGGAISWTSSGTSTTSFSWELQRGQAASLATTPGFRSDCGTGGQAYINLIDSAVELDLALENDNGLFGCHVAFSWTDAAGQAQKLAPVYSEGVTTSLPAGAAITWTSVGSAGGASQYFWQIERVPSSKP